MMLGFAVDGAANAAKSFAYPSFSGTVARAALASAGAYLFISVHFDFHTGDLNPSKTVPMLGTHKMCMATLTSPSVSYVST